jgi:hypothetical protein
MKPYIISVDRTNSMGKIIGEFGDDRWNNGFIRGFIYGLCIGARGYAPFGPTGTPTNKFS